MPPTTPVFDPRGFQDLVDEAKRRIPQYCPEWTDHNVSDPGVTLIELFAWMTDLLLYRLNRVPERDYLKFLELIGAQPRPAVPATTELTFWLTAPQTETMTIPRGTEVATRQTESRPAITFTTDSDLEILVPALQHWVLARRRDEAGGVAFAFEDRSERLGWEMADVEVFQEVPREGDAFYLGFRDNLAGHVIRLNIRCELLRAPNIRQDDPPLIWEFWNGERWATLMPVPDELALLRQVEPECAELGPRMDDTRGLNRTAPVILVIPRSCVRRAMQIRDTSLEACWLRCRSFRRRGDEPFYDRSPVVHGFEPESIGGIVPARHAFEVVGEDMGRSDGDPGQRFALLNPPILPRRLEDGPPEMLEVEGTDDSFEPWTEVETFSDSSPTDSHYVIDDLTGEVGFGPRLREPGGEERQYGRVPPKDRMIRFTRYRSGGGSIGNVGRGTLVVQKSGGDLPYVKFVTNLRPALGGRDRETIDAFKLRGPKLVRTREVAVTRSDFEHLAREASPQAARVHCVGPGSGPDPNGAAPNHVEVLLVPAVSTADEPVPRQQLEMSDDVRELCRQVRAFLEERCLLTTELSVGPPIYRWVRARAVLAVRPRPTLSASDRERERIRIQDEARRRLYRFIHPVIGGPDGTGWPFGKSLSLADIYPVLHGIDGVEYVREVGFRVVTPDPDGVPRPEAEVALVELKQNMLVCSDVHEVSVVEL